MLFEGVWGADDTVRSSRKIAPPRRCGRALGVEDHHHAPYPDDVLAQLPLAEMTSPVPLIDMVRRAGWRRLRIQRLRDVEWAALQRDRGRSAGWSARARYALIADA